MNTIGLMIHLQETLMIFRTEKCTSVNSIRSAILFGVKIFLSKYFAEHIRSFQQPMAIIWVVPVAGAGIIKGPVLTIMSLPIHLWIIF